MTDLGTFLPSSQNIYFTMTQEKNGELQRIKNKIDGD
jgi:hypothetical protein